MCFFPKPPKLTPLPAAPTPDSDAVRARELREQERLAALSGSQPKTDLVPGSLVGQRRVLLGA